MPSLAMRRNEERIKEISQEFGITRTTAIELLLDFYELKDIEILIQQVRIKHKEGFNSRQISQLTVLLTQLSLILQSRI